MAGGQPFASATTLFAVEGRPHVYLLDNGQKRHVTSPEKMDIYNFKWPTTKIGALVADAIPDGTPI